MPITSPSDDVIRHSATPKNEQDVLHEDRTIMNKITSSFDKDTSLTLLNDPYIFKLKNQCKGNCIILCSKFGKQIVVSEPTTTNTFKTAKTTKLENVPDATVPIGRRASNAIATIFNVGEELGEIIPCVPLSSGNIKFYITENDDVVKILCDMLPHAHQCTVAQHGEPIALFITTPRGSSMGEQSRWDAVTMSKATTPSDDTSCLSQTGDICQQLLTKAASFFNSPLLEPNVFSYSDYCVSVAHSHSRKQDRLKIISKDMIINNLPKPSTVSLVMVVPKESVAPVGSPIPTSNICNANAGTKAFFNYIVNQKYALPKGVILICPEVMQLEDFPEYLSIWDTSSKTWLRHRAGIRNFWKAVDADPKYNYNSPMIEPVIALPSRTIPKLLRCHYKIPTCVLKIKDHNIPSNNKNDIDTQNVPPTAEDEVGDTDNDTGIVNDTPATRWQTIIDVEKWRLSELKMLLWELYRVGLGGDMSDLDYLEIIKQSNRSIVESLVFEHPQIVRALGEIKRKYYIEYIKEIPLDAENADDSNPSGASYHTNVDGDNSNATVQHSMLFNVNDPLILSIKTNANMLQPTFGADASWSDKRIKDYKRHTKPPRKSKGMHQSAYDSNGELVIPIISSRIKINDKDIPHTPGHEGYEYTHNKTFGTVCNERGPVAIQAALLPVIGPNNPNANNHISSKLTIDHIHSQLRFAAQVRARFCPCQTDVVVKAIKTISDVAVAACTKSSCGVELGSGRVYDDNLISKTSFLNDNGTLKPSSRTYEQRQFDTDRLKAMRTLLRFNPRDGSTSIGVDPLNGGPVDKKNVNTTRELFSRAIMDETILPSSCIESINNVTRHRMTVLNNYHRNIQVLAQCDLTKPHSSSGLTPSDVLTSLLKEYTRVYSNVCLLFNVRNNTETNKHDESEVYKGVLKTLGLLESYVEDLAYTKMSNKMMSMVDEYNNENIQDMTMTSSPHSNSDMEPTDVESDDDVNLVSDLSETDIPFNINMEPLHTTTTNLDGGSVVPFSTQDYKHPEKYTENEESDSDKFNFKELGNEIVFESSDYTDN